MDIPIESLYLPALSIRVFCFIEEQWRLRFPSQIVISQYGMASGGSLIKRWSQSRTTLIIKYVQM